MTANIINSTRNRSLIIRSFIFISLFICSVAQGEANKPLVVSQDAAWPPFAYLDEENVPRGLLIDLWEVIASQMDREVTFKLVDWQASLDQVTNGQADLHGGLFYSEERDRYLDFPLPDLLTFKTSLFVNADSQIASFAEIKDLPVGAVKGGLEAAFVRQHHPQIKLRLFENNQGMIKAAIESQIQFFIADYPVAIYFLNRYTAANRFIAKQTLYSKPLKTAVKQDNLSLLSEIEAALKALPAAEYERIQQKWLITIEKEVIPDWLFYSFLISLLALISAFLFSYTFLLRKQVKTRTQELHQLNIEFEMLARKAEKANQTKSQFLAKMSHELRTPMHAILSFSAIGKKNADNDKLERLFENINTSGQRLTRLIDNLLDISKMEAGKVEPEFHQSDIVKLIKNTLIELESLINDQQLKINLDYDSEISLLLDRAMMTQVMINLLSNAIKFSPGSGQIDVGISQQNDKLLISVSDEGDGIPADRLEVIFEAFVQNDTDQTSKGTGLGLPICREIVTLHGGRIWAQSPPTNKARGTQFNVELPLKIEK